MRRLGEYELAGLPEPEPLFQLVAHDLPSEFPPLRAARRRDVKPVRVVVADDSILVREGIASVLTKAGLDVVAETARRVARGEAALDAAVVADLFRRRECEALQALAPFEREVLALVAQGLPDDVIAHRLFLPLAEAEQAVASTLARIGLDPVADPSRRTLDLLVGLAQTYFAAAA